MNEKFMKKYIFHKIIKKKVEFFFNIVSIFQPKI